MSSPESLTKVTQIVSDIYALVRGNAIAYIDENGDVQIIPESGRKVYINGSEVITDDYVDSSPGGLLRRENNLSDVGDASTALNNLGGGTAAVKDVMASPTDNTVADAVLMIGSWGLGSGGIGSNSNVAMTNANTITNTGFFYTNSAFTGKPSSAGTVGALLHINQVSNANTSLRVWTQLYFDINNNKIFIRFKPSGTASTSATWTQMYPADAATLDGYSGPEYLLVERGFTEFNALADPVASKLAARTELLGPSGLGEKAKQIDGLAARYFGGKSTATTQYALTIPAGNFLATTVNNSVGGVGPENDVANILGLPAGSNWFVINLAGPLTGAYSARQIWISTTTGETYHRVLTSASADWSVTQIQLTEIGDTIRTYKSLDNSWLPLDGKTHTSSDYPHLAAMFGATAIEYDWMSTASLTGSFTSESRMTATNTDRMFITRGPNIFWFDAWKSTTSALNSVTGVVGTHTYTDSAFSRELPDRVLFVGYNSFNVPVAMWCGNANSASPSVSSITLTTGGSGEKLRRASFSDDNLNDFIAVGDDGYVVRINANSGVEKDHIRDFQASTHGSGEALSNANLTNVQWKGVAASKYRTVIVGTNAAGTKAWLATNNGSDSNSGWDVAAFTTRRFTDIVYDESNDRFYILGYDTSTSTAGVWSVPGSENTTSAVRLFTGTASAYDLNTIVVTRQSIVASTPLGKTLVVGATNTTGGIQKTSIKDDSDWTQSTTDGISGLSSIYQLCASDQYLYALTYDGLSVYLYRIAYTELIQEDVVGSGVFTLPKVISVDGGPQMYIKAKKVRT